MFGDFHVQLCEGLPTWDVYHTGGNIYNADKDFTTKDGRTVMVLINDRGSFVYHNHGNESDFVSKSQYDADNELSHHWVELTHFEDHTILMPLANELFAPEIVKEITDAVEKMSAIVWEDAE